MSMYSRSFSILSILSLVVLSLVSSCSDPAERAATESARLLARAKDREESVATLEGAIQRYRELAQSHPKAEAGAKAAQRVGQLESAREFLARTDSVDSDSLQTFYESFCREVPAYPPAMRKLGKIYYDQTYLMGRTAARLQAESFVSSTLFVWAKQDSLWSDYTFRATSEDRDWRDRLCKQAVDVARMLEARDRFSEALAIVLKGIDYAAGDAVAARAKVYASYYTFTVGDNESAIQLADEAIAEEHLADSDKAKAYHVLGLGYTYIYEASRELPDLDSAIQALNESVSINPAMSQPKELLQTLRVTRQKLPL